MIIPFDSVIEVIRDLTEVGIIEVCVTLIAEVTFTVVVVDKAVETVVFWLTLFIWFDDFSVVREGIEVFLVVVNATLEFAEDIFGPALVAVNKTDVLMPFVTRVVRNLDSVV